MQWSCSISVRKNGRNVLQTIFTRDSFTTRSQLLLNNEMRLFQILPRILDFTGRSDSLLHKQRFFRHNIQHVGHNFFYRSVHENVHLTSSFAIIGRQILKSFSHNQTTLLRYLLLICLFGLFYQIGHCGLK